jgi:glucokinase
MTAVVADVGGTRIKWALTADGERLAERGVEPSPSDAAGVLAALVALTRRFDATALLLALPGLVDPEAGVWRRSANLGARDVAVRAPLAEQGIAVEVLANDVGAAAAGEAAGGTLALLQLGSGVGARVVVDGRPIDGRHGMAGEVGHLVIDPAGPPCGCGRRGCVEAVAGWRAVRPQLERLGVEPDPVRLLDDPAPPAQRALAETVFGALGFAAATLVTAADPGEIRLGGGLATAWGAEGAARVAAAMRDRLLEELAAATTVTTSRLGDDAALEGLLHLRRAAARP